jgi:hypothetical protein
MNPRAVLSHPLCYFYMRQIMSLDCRSGNG